MYKVYEHVPGLLKVFLKVLVRLLKARLKVLLKVLIRLLKARLKVLLKVLLRLLKARLKVHLKVLIRALVGGAYKDLISDQIRRFHSYELS